MGPDVQRTRFCLATGRTKAQPFCLALLQMGLCEYASESILKTYFPTAHNLLLLISETGPTELPQRKEQHKVGD
jgi:hypothetical protein